jgi:hypothetical protein
MTRYIFYTHILPTLVCFARVCYRHQTDYSTTPECVDTGKPSLCIDGTRLCNIVPNLYRSESQLAAYRIL